MNLGIRTKTVVITTGIMFFAIGATILTSGYLFTEAYTESLQSRSLAVGKSLKLQLDRLLQLGLRVEALTGFDEQCRDIVSKYEGIEYAMVTDLQGRILFHNDPAQQGRMVTDKSLLAALKNSEDKVAVFMDHGARHYNAFIPVFAMNGIHIAAVGIGFQAEIIAAKTNEMARYALGVGLICLGCAVVALRLLLSSQVTRPLTKLLDAMEEIREKGTDFARKVDIGSRDEIGRLTLAFDMMTAELQKSKEGLELKVAERTRQLLQVQEELVRKEKLAMLGLIAGGMGNELRNPLGVMNNAVFFLKSVLTDADETVREYLEIITNEIDNSQRIISDLLDFNSVNTPRIRPTPVGDLIRQCLDRCSVPENIRLQADTPELSPKALVDPTQMGQVLKNLITNALQAMPDGGALRIAARQVRGSRFEVRGPEESVERRTPNVEPDGDFIEISVTDTGEGISPEHMGNLFQPLFSTRSRGIGLGLALSRKLAEANGGWIEVESRLEEGTTFRVMLPAASF